MLARTGYATGPIQAALAAAGIPHRVLGSLGLYERAEVRDALAYLALLANPRRRAGVPPRRAVAAARHRPGHRQPGRRRRARAPRRRPDHRQRPRRTSSTGSARQPARDAARRASAPASTRVRRPNARRALARPRRRRHRDARRRPRRATTSSAATARPSAEQRRDAERVLEDLRSLCRAAQAFEDQHGTAASLTGFLEHAAGLHAQEITAGEDRRITVSTIHRAKGTEAQLVILLGCEEQLLPSWRALASPDPEDLAEERRLFYVAATRAKDRLVDHPRRHSAADAPPAAPRASSPRPA